MTSVSTVSSGTSGTYKSYDFATPSYDTDLPTIAHLGGSRGESAKSYEGTGGCEKRWPRGAPERTSANRKAARALPRIMRPRGRARRRGGGAMSANATYRAWGGIFGRRSDCTDCGRSNPAEAPCCWKCGGNLEVGA